MPNEVRIYVKAYDETGTAFRKVREEAHKTTSDIEGEFTKAGPKVGKALSDGASKGFLMGAPGWAVPAAAIGVAMSPILGGAIAAGVVGAAGGLGIAGGLALAAKDPKVEAASASLGKEVGKGLQEASSSFVPVALSSINKVRAEFRKLQPDIKSIFDDSSKLVAPLLDGALSGFEKVIGGIRSAVSKAEPVFQQFGALADNVGGAIGDLFENMGDHAEEGASAVNDLSVALVGIINAGSAVITLLADFKGAIDSSREGLYRWMDSLPKVSFLHDMASGYEENSQAIKLWRDGVIDAKGGANDYEHYLRNLTHAQEAQADATDNQTSALAKLASEMKAQTDPLYAMITGTRRVKEAQDKYNEALREHGPKSKQAKEALSKLGEAAFDLNSKATAAAGGFNGKLTPAMRSALNSAGLTKPQIAALERQLKSAAAAANNWEGTYRQKFITSYVTNFTGPKSQLPYGTGRASGGITGAASGATSSGLTWVGEHGPELMQLPAGTSVKSNPDSMRLANQSGQGGGGGMQTIILQVDGQTIAQATLPALQKLNRTQFAGDVTKMFPATR